jgi:hypothetical protein
MERQPLTAVNIPSWMGRISYLIFWQFVPLISISERDPAPEKRREGEDYIMAGH